MGLSSLVRCITLALAALLFSLDPSGMVDAGSMNVAVTGWLSVTSSSNVPVGWIGLHGLHTMWLLAIKHFNERFDRFVPKLGQLGSCNKTIELVGGKLFDDHGKASDGIQALLEANALGVHLMLGAIRSSVTVPLSIAAGALNIPVVSHWATSQALANRAVHPLFTRTIPSDVSVAATMAEAFKLWKFRHVGVRLHYFRAVGIQTDPDLQR